MLMCGWRHVFHSKLIDSCYSHNIFNVFENFKKSAKMLQGKSYAFSIVLLSEAPQ